MEGRRVRRPGSSASAIAGSPYRRGPGSAYRFSRRWPPSPGARQRANLVDCGVWPLKVSTAVRENEVIERIDAFCDAVPRRRSRADEHGPLVIFVPTGPGWPYYARPKRGARAPVTATRHPRRARPAAGTDHPGVLRVDRADRARDGCGRGRSRPGGPDPPAHGAGRAGQAAAAAAGVTVRIVAPQDAELDRIWAVPTVAFGHPGTATGEAGVAERDKIAADHDGGTIAMLRERLRSGQSVVAAAFGPDGPVGGRKLPGGGRRGRDHRRGRAARRTPPGPGRGGDRRPGRATPLTAGCRPSSCQPATRPSPASTPASASARSAPP